MTNKLKNIVNEAWRFISFKDIKELRKLKKQCFEYSGISDYILRGASVFSTAAGIAGLVNHDYLTAGFGIAVGIIYGIGSYGITKRDVKRLKTTTKSQDENK